ncbi:MAG: hypothetical protein WCH46_01200 [bacterium]
MNKIFHIAFVSYAVFFCAATICAQNNAIFPDIGNVDHNFWGIGDDNMSPLSPIENFICSTALVNAGHWDLLHCDRQHCKATFSASLSPRMQSTVPEGSCIGHEVYPDGVTKAKRADVFGAPDVVDTCSILKRWLSRDAQPGYPELAKEQYDSLRLYVERCANDKDSYKAFTSLDGALQLMNQDTNRFDAHRAWLASVLYLNTTTPAYFCECVGSMLSTFQAGKYMAIGILSIEQFMCHLHDPHCNDYCKGFSTDSLDLVQHGFDVQHLPPLDSLGLSVLLKADVKASPIGIGMPYLASVNSTPNPFTSETTLDFTLNRMTYVTVGVYDELGRWVWGDSHGYSLEAGKHTVYIDGKDLPYGALYARISTGFGEVKTVKIMHE